MKINLVWPECDAFELDKNGGPEDVFWVECDYNEATDTVLRTIRRRFPRKVNKIAAEIEKYHTELDNSPESSHTKVLREKGYVYLLVSRNLKLIKPMPHYFPYAGQWNAYNPFLRVFPQTIYELEEIQTVDATPVKIKEMHTWAGKHKFWYVGSVEQGVMIHYGQGKQIGIRPSLFAETLGYYSGRSVVVSTSRANKDQDSLGKWLSNYDINAVIASHVAAILVAEGLAERDKDPAMLRFVDGIRLELDYEKLSEYVMPLVSVYG